MEMKVKRNDKTHFLDAGYLKPPHHLVSGFQRDYQRGVLCVCALGRDDSRSAITNYSEALLTMFTWTCSPQSR